MARSSKSRRRLEAVVENEAFALVYQPIVHLTTGTITGVEALCRFEDDDPPAIHFEEAEALGLAAELDLAIISRALRELPATPDGYVALNLSPSTLLDARLPRLLLGPDVPTNRLVVELTEHARIADYDASRAILAELRDGGVHLAVDDVGAGYASFRHVLSLRPDIIKMDESLTRDIDQDAARRTLATALVIFAGELGASIVAEGVETQDELLTLRRIGVHRAQGFAVARPGILPVAEIAYTPVSLGELLEVPADDLDLLARDHESVAVAAHDLLASVAAVEAALALLEHGTATVDPQHQRSVIATGQRHAKRLEERLRSMILGLGPEVVAAESTSLVSAGPHGNDSVLEALDGLTVALRTSIADSNDALQRASDIRRQRLAGASYSEIADSAEQSLLVTLLAENERRLRGATSLLRRAAVRALYAEGKTMEEIARLLDVTRQRISTVLKAEDCRARPAGASE